MATIKIGVGFLVIQSVLLIGAVEAQNINYGRNNNECTTPNNELGNCIPFRSCEPLVGIITAYPLVQEAVQFLRNSHCGFDPNNSKEPMVCCPRINTNTNERGENRLENANVIVRSNPNLPANCGTDLSSRIVGGEIAEINEFPWMALLEYNKPNGKTTACGGVLISSRYILTAAHCIKGKDLPKSWSLNAVRLGEYNTSAARDCVYDDNFEICTDDPVTVPIEEKIVHESYDPNERTQRNDIALLRLRNNVQFTDYIKPICLPTSGNIAQKLWVAGWGRTETKSESDVKLKLGISPVDLATCSQRYSRAGINLSNTQLCAGGQRGKDSCRGDSGGPLMSLEMTPEGLKRWISVGIVSFGPTPCGMLNWPGVYTKIIDYVPWILSKIRA